MVLSLVIMKNIQVIMIFLKHLNFLIIQLYKYKENILNLEDIQNKLKKLYTIEIENLGDIKNLTESPTNPLLLSLPDNYDKTLKVMLFGQETNDWQKQFNKELDIDRSISTYRKFWIDKTSNYSKKGPLMQTFNTFQNKIGKYNQVSCIWNNIIKIGKYNQVGTPNKETRNWQIKWRDVIRKEVELLEPDMIVFFTGPNYDIHIEDVFGSFSKEIYNNQKINKITKLNFHNNQKFVAYRTYHPGYLRRSGLSKEYIEYFTTEVHTLLNKKLMINKISSILN